jgi:hypothetical protein
MSVVGEAGIGRTAGIEATETAPEPARVLRLAMRIAISQLASGAQTDDIERPYATSPTATASGAFRPRSRSR